jgi:transcription elongation GreA/GreB family factor
MDRIDKQALVARLRESIARDLDAATRAAKDAAEAATHEENRPESDKDMRSTEASYLARGQAERVRELERCDDALRALDLGAWKEGVAIGAGALVVIDCDGKRAAYLIAPAGGGLRAAAGKMEVQVVTPRSPVGQALVGQTTGDVVQVTGPGGLREMEILDVQ